MFELRKASFMRSNECVCVCVCAGMLTELWRNVSVEGPSGWRSDIKMICCDHLYAAWKIKPLLLNAALLHSYKQMMTQEAITFLSKEKSEDCFGFFFLSLCVAILTKHLYSVQKKSILITSYQFGCKDLTANFSPLQSKSDLCSVRQLWI